MTRQQVLDLYFLDARHKLIELGAFLDRLARADGAADFRLSAFRAALARLAKPGSDKAKAVLLAFSDPTRLPMAKAASKAACGAWPDQRRRRRLKEPFRPCATWNLTRTWSAG